MIYLDSGVLIRAVLKHHPAYKACSILIHRDAVSSTHSLAEAFNTLTSHFQVANSDAALALASLRDRMELEPITLEDYLRVLGDARRSGVQGGLIYDALHAHVARRLKVQKIVTFNIRHFRHVAPDLQIEEPHGVAN